MVSRDENKYVIYPVYFDKTVSRKQGRKVARKYAVEKPSSENISKAATSLGLHPTLEKDRAHSSAPWKREGRVMVDSRGQKTKLLLQIANRL